MKQTPTFQAKNSTRQICIPRNLKGGIEYHIFAFKNGDLRLQEISVEHRSNKHIHHPRACRRASQPYGAGRKDTLCRQQCRNVPGSREHSTQVCTSIHSKRRRRCAFFNISPSKWSVAHMRFTHVQGAKFCSPRRLKREPLSCSPLLTAS